MKASSVLCVAGHSWYLLFFWLLDYLDFLLGWITRRRRFTRRWFLDLRVEVKNDAGLEPDTYRWAEVVNQGILSPGHSKCGKAKWSWSSMNAIFWPKPVRSVLYSLLCVPMRTLTVHCLPPYYASVLYHITVKSMRIVHHSSSLFYKSLWSKYVDVPDRTYNYQGTPGWTTRTFPLLDSQSTVHWKLLFILNLSCPPICGLLRSSSECWLYGMYGHSGLWVLIDWQINAVMSITVITYDYCEW